MAKPSLTLKYMHNICVYIYMYIAYVYRRSKIKGAYLSFAKIELLCLSPSGVPVRLIVFEIEYLKIERALVKYYETKFLDRIPRK